MFYAGAVYDIKVEIGKPQTTMCESSGRICKIEDSLESVVISAYDETSPFEVRAEEKD